MTTYAEVPWNAPYYRRLGFQDVPPDRLTPELRQVRRAETAHGLDRWPRVAMRRQLDGRGEGARRARIGDVHDIALGMPFTRRLGDAADHPVYQVGGKSFVFFRTARPDAVDEHGDPMADVIVLWVPSEADKLSLLQDTASPFFTTPHFDGHLSVLVRGRDIGRSTLAELTEVVQDAWLSRASARRAKDWLDARALG